MKLTLVLSCLILYSGLALGQTPTASTKPNYPTPAEGDYVLANFQFRSGESLPESTSVTKLRSPRRT